MMEVTPHLKTVLKNYQHSATKSLQGPGLSLVTKTEIPSPELKEEEFAPVQFPVQQVPILAAADTSCSERTETTLEGESISCFVVGGEKRLCLPQVLNSVLRDFSLQQINQECDHLQIYCSRCTPEQLNVLKNQGILPSGAPSCGLIKKTDAERLCSALLYGHTVTPMRPHKNALSFPVYHECFGESRGLCFPELYTGKNAKCIECADCQGGFSPQQFVCHVHRNLENRTVHWGFDSNSHWRWYLKVPEEHVDHKQFEKYLDEMREQYEGKLPFPTPVVVEPAIKRKQVTTSDLIKERPAELPLKKQKLDEYLRLPFGLPTVPASLQQIYASLDPVYIQHCLQDFGGPGGVNRHLSAFKPVVQSIKESKIRHANALGITTRYTPDPPVLQNPERVVRMSESERFERSYQPNVALAPPTPKKHRYGRVHENTSPTHTCTSTIQIKSEAIKVEPQPETTSINGHHVKEEDVRISPEKIIDSTVSVVQSGHIVPKYNPEIELSTDTEDSASETSERHSDYVKIEEALKTVDGSIRDRVLDLYRNLAKELERVVQENRNKDDKISELELRNTELSRQIEEYKCKSTTMEPDNVASECKRDNDVSSSSIIVANSTVGVVEETVDEGKTVVDDEKIEKIEQPSVIIASVGEHKEVQSVISDDQ